MGVQRPRAILEDAQLGKVGVLRLRNLDQISDTALTVLG